MSINIDKTLLEMLDEQPYPDRPVFWVPTDAAKVPVNEWKNITYAQFHASVFAAKEFYASHTKQLGIPKSSVIGLWLSGGYTDLIHMLGVTAAGYIPQLFSVMYSHSPVVFELLAKAGAKALVSSRMDPSDCPVPVIHPSAPNFDSTTSGGKLSDQSRSYAVVKNDIAMIMHSSGSTATIPTLIPWTHRYLTSFFYKAGVNRQRDGGAVRVYSTAGPFSHGSSLGMFIGCIPYGDSMVIPSSVAFSSTELTNMVKFCGLNMLFRLVTFMVNTLEQARNDPELLSLLRSLRVVGHGAMSLPTEYEEWAYSVGLHLVSVFGSTECGMTLASTSPSCPTSHLKLSDYPNLSYKMAPFEQDRETKLYELTVLPDSIDCPQTDLLHQDGTFHTGDLFELHEDGHYIYRGRTNDWIKVGTGSLCDTKSIEDAVKHHCKDLVADCVVVGANRRGPALLVEPADGVGDDLAKIIVQRLTAFNQSRFAHERLDDPGLVLILGRNALPRTATKGNVRRKAAEEAFSKELDAMYAATAPKDP